MTQRTPAPEPAPGSRLVNCIVKNKQRIKTAMIIMGGILALSMYAESLMGKIVFACFIDEERVQKLEYGYIMPMRAGEWELAYAIMKEEEQEIRKASKAMRTSWRLSTLLNPIKSHRNLRRAFTAYANATERNYTRTRAFCLKMIKQQKRDQYLAKWNR
jgi:hypothetical protein